MFSDKFEAISINELYDNEYQCKPPLIDGLLYPGVYLFVGAPKLGKSFLMAQLAHHISTGTPLWDYLVRKSTVLYLALEDDYPAYEVHILCLPFFIFIISHFNIFF